jgi:cell division protein FtsW
MNRVRVDHLLLLCLLFLMGLGVVLVYSSSWALADRLHEDALYFLKRQSFFAGCAMVALLVGAAIDPDLLRKHAYWILGGAMALLLLVLIPGVGPKIGLARRWIALGPFHLQAGEVAKVALLIYLAMSIAKKGPRMASFSIGVAPHAVVVLAVVSLLLAEPDFGTATMLLGVSFAMLFVGGAKLRVLVLGGVAALPFVVFLVLSSPYRMKRVMAFLDPWAHRYDIGYQVTESLMTFGSGGATGLGVGDGVQKLFFLPAAHTDFIFAVLGEELGFAGVLACVTAFLLILMRGARAALMHADPFRALLAFGLTTTLVVQALMNMAVVLGLVPTKGLTLPFMSYGGSSLIMCGFIGGLLLRLSGEVPEGRSAAATVPPQREAWA